MAVLTGWAAGVRLADAAADGVVFEDVHLERHGVWRTAESLGSDASGPVLAAWTMRTAILPLARSEAVYFWARHDAAGRRLDPDCAYEIEIPEFDARWWSLTVYDGDLRPIANRIDRYSINSAAGVSVVHAARAEPAEPARWLPLGEAEGIEFFLRIYQPGESFDPARSGALPEIRRVSEC